VRLLGRSAVECTRDVLAEAIATDVAAVAAAVPPSSGLLVIDPFVGTGNTLHWILRRLEGARGVAFELDPAVYQLTRRNLALLGLPIDVVQDDCLRGLGGVAATDAELVVAFVAPPWGRALGAIVFTALVVSGAAPRFVLLMAGLDGAGALWTWSALRRPRR